MKYRVTIVKGEKVLAIPHEKDKMVVEKGKKIKEFGISSEQPIQKGEKLYIWPIARAFKVISIEHLSSGTSPSCSVFSVLNVKPCKM